MLIQCLLYATCIAIRILVERIQIKGEVCDVGRELPFFSDVQQVVILLNP
tara:strand:- start:34 stop:183 length:150 start_codon:yes stop_codon:yes gene_type:complete